MTGLTRVHLIGIGGAGMSGIARVLLARGAEVSGSDQRDSLGLDALRTLGATIHVGHGAENLGAADTVVVSTAIRDSNPELVAARAAGRQVLRRADALAALLTGSRSVAVAGTHGKTTTTSMLTVAAQHCGVDPSYVIGGDLNEAGSNAHQGHGDLFLLEADESDESFLAYHPLGGIVTNVEADHLDHYGTAEAVEQAFVAFVRTIDAGGFFVASADDDGARRLAARAAPLRTRTYGTADDATLRMADLDASGAGSSWTAVLAGEPLGRVQLRVPGAHMARNSAAALLAGLELGLPATELISGLATYTGVRRRMEPKGTAAGVRVFDDYAHHPTEVRAQLLAARGITGGGRLVAVFQPHMYSRTRAFAAAFGQALGLADEVVVMDVYGAREDPVPGVSGALVAAEVPLPGRVHFEPSWSAVPPAVVARVEAGDVVLTLGAGDVTQVGPEVLRLLEERA